MNTASIAVICRHSRKWVEIDCRGTSLLIFVVDGYRSSSCQLSQSPAAVNSYVSDREGMHEGGDPQDQETMEPHYDQPEKFIVSHAQ